MKFLIDANLPPALAAWLQDRNHDAEHVFENHDRGELDREIWRAAISAGQAIITKDTDFLHMALADDAGPPIVLVRCGNLGLQAFGSWFMLRYPSMLAALESGEKVVELA